MASNKSLKTKAYNILKEKIVNCEYAPGSLLNEAKLAEELGLSRTPIREAISILEMQDFLRVVPKKGIVVADILLSDFVQIFQVRMTVEPTILKLVGPNIATEKLLEWKKVFTENSEMDQNFTDTAMHMFFIQCYRNTYITEMMEKVFDKNTRVILTSTENKKHLENARREHIEILDLLLNQDYDKAANQMYLHITNCRNAAFDFFYSK